MFAVRRFPLRIDDDQLVDMPIGSTILSVQAHRNQVVLWVLVNTDEKSVICRRFLLMGTNVPMPPNTQIPMDRIQAARIYLGTVQQEEGTVVWHVFEVV